MRIGIDIFSFDKPGENYGVGPGVYVWHLLPELFNIGKEHKFFIFANKENCDRIPKFSNVIVITDKIPNKFRPNRIFHEQFFIPFIFFKYKLDFVHYLGNNISYLLAEKSILTVYDLMWKYYRDLGERSVTSKYFAITVPYSIKKAKAVITISEFIAKEIKEKNIRTNKIYSILLAPGNVLKNINDLKSNYDELAETPYIYSVTTSMPHKNLKLLLIAFNMIIKQKLFIGKLVISGQLKGNYKEDTFNYISSNNLTEYVIITGFVSEEDKAFLYRHALCFVYPSLYEGFGLPVLEAMASNVPVIASNAASIPEVGGEACLYFNPNSAEDLINKILLLLNNPELRKELIEKGKVQFSKFNWHNVAIETLNIFENIFGLTKS